VCYVTYSKWSKHGDSLSPFRLNFASEYAIRMVQETLVEPQLSGTDQLLVCVDEVNVLGG
jgi:hypothetical protein